MTTSYTINFRMPVPDFMSEPWHGPLQSLFQSVDNLVYQALIVNNITLWLNATAYNVGNIRIDGVDGSTWLCKVAHTSVVGPTTFAQDRTNHPTFWARFASQINPRGAYTNLTAYAYYDLVYDPNLRIIALCTTPYTSAANPANLNTEAANWAFLAVFPVATTAASISYDHSASGLAAITAQAALDEIVVDLNVTNASIASKANIASPTFTGDPKAPTAVIGDNDTSIATTAFVQAALAAMGIGTGTALLTLETIAPTGWVMMNDGTIGSALSGANTRPANDTVALFTLIYNNVADAFAPLLTAVGGATSRAIQGSAATAFAANCRITLPLQLGRAIAINGTGAGLSARVLGQTLGEETHTLTAGELALHTHAAFSGAETHTHSLPDSAGTGTYASNTGSTNPFGPPGNSGAANPGITIRDQAGGAGNTNQVASNGGTIPPGGAAHNNMQPTVFWNIKVKL